MAGKTVEMLEKWASAVQVQVKRYPELHTVLPNTSEWRAKGNVVPSMFEPLHHAYTGGGWSTEALTKIGVAMQAWRGKGRINGLHAMHLREHLNHKTGLRAPGPSKKPKDGPPRWKTAAAVTTVAGLISKHGIALRRLLKLNMPVAEVPTLETELEAARELAAQVPKLKTALKKAKDAHAHSAARLKKQKKGITKAQRAKLKEAVKAAAARITEKARLKAAADAERQIAAAGASLAETLAKQTAKASEAQKRAKKVEGMAKAYAKCLKRAQRAEATVRDLRIDLDEAAEEQLEERLESPGTSESHAKLARRSKDGRFQAEPWQQRVLKWAQLGRGVAPSTVNANITEVLTIYASEALVPQPCQRQMRKLRSEVAIAGEMIAALRVALAIRIISFGFDESTKWGLGLLSTNTQIEPHDAPGTSIDVVMRGATLTAGGTAEHISKQIEEKLFAHARRLLTLWKEEHEDMYPGTWDSSGMPSPDNIGLHRLSENAVIMSDTCNPARATKRLLAEMAEKAGRERIGTEAWEKLSEEEREEKVKCHLGDCHDHMRNIIIKAMSTAATTFLESKLADSLETFSSFDRVSVDGMEVIRAACKELHPNGEYAKGR